MLGASIDFRMKEEVLSFLPTRELELDSLPSPGNLGLFTVVQFDCSVFILQTVSVQTVYQENGMKYYRRMSAPLAKHPFKVWVALGGMNASSLKIR